MLNKYQKESIIKGAFAGASNAEIAIISETTKENVYAYRSRQHITQNNIKWLILDGYDSESYIKEFLAEKKSYKELQMCDCCGNAANNDDEYILPDGLEVKLCDQCAAVNTYLAAHQEVT